MKKIIKKIIQIIYNSFIYKILIVLGYCFGYTKTKKTVVGCAEVAGVLFSLKEMYGEKVFSYNRIKNPYFEHYAYDKELNERRFLNFIILPFIFGTLVRKAKCFIYIGGTAFTSNNDDFKEIELSFISKRNIPIIEIFLGSEIRSPLLFKEKAELENRNTYYDYLPYKVDVMEKTAKKFAELADKYACLVFSHKNDQLSYLKSKQLFFPPIFSQTKIHNCIEKFNKIETIKILHAPSNPNVKGTPIVRAVIKKLKSEGYKFDYVELIGVNNSIVINELISSHIVLNQFYLLIPGIFGLEAMANCNAVLQSALPAEFPYDFNDAWFETKDWQLYDNLKYLLDNPNKIKYYAENGYKYIKKNFNNNTIKEYLDGYLLDYIS